MSVHLLGSATEASIGRLGRFQQFNRALSVAEAASLFTTGVAEVDRAGSALPLYESDFSAGKDGWADQGASADGNIDGIGGQDNTLRSTATQTSSATIRKLNSFVSGKRYKVSFDVFVPSSNTTCRSVGIFFNPSTAIPNRVSDNFNLTNAYRPAVDTWETVNIDFVATGSESWRLFQFSVSGANTTTIGDVVYIKNFRVDQLCNTADLAPPSIQLTPGQWLDTSGNGKPVYLPEGVRLGRPSRRGDLSSVLTWNAETGGKPVGGVDAPVLPVDCRFTVAAKASVAGTFDIGDGVDADRYAAAVDIGTSWQDIELLTSYHDGANREIVLTATGPYVGRVTTSVEVRVLA